MSRAQHALLCLAQEKPLECAKQYLTSICQAPSKMHLGKIYSVEDTQSHHIIFISPSHSPTTCKFKIQIVFVGSCPRLWGNISEHNIQSGSSLGTGFVELGAGAR